MRQFGKELGELRDLVLEAIKDEDDPARVVRDEMDVRLQDVVKPGNLVADQLLVHIQSREALVEFIDALNRRLVPTILLQHPEAKALNMAIGSVVDPNVAPNRVSYTVNTEPGSSVTVFQHGTQLGSASLLRRHPEPRGLDGRYPGISGDSACGTGSHGAAPMPG
jgi:hypothetical protein